MKMISEAASSQLVTWPMVFSAVRKAFIEAANPAAVTFPAVIGHGSEKTNRFSIKSGATSDLAGLKVGAFWPENPARGLPRHSSTIFLIDQETGRIGALIEASTVNAFRTAAANAVAASELAREDSKTIALFGAGNQGFHECLALAQIRPIETVYVVVRGVEGGADRAAACVTRLVEAGINACVSEAEAACRAADIIVTATPARSSLFDASWVLPGTYIAAMGADAAGKGELPVALLENAALFCDLAEQSVLMGEFQSVREGIQAGRIQLMPIGAVLDGRQMGRQNAEQITVFDSSGIALQDLYVGQAILDAFTREDA